MARGDNTLFNTGIFAQTDVPSTRQAVRDRLFTNVVNRFGGDSNITRGAATAGALLGGGLNSFFGGKDPRIARQEGIQRVQQKVSETGLDPSNPEFFDVTARLFEEEGLPDLAQRTRLQGFQIQSQQPQPEPLESAITVTGGTPQGDAFLKRFPNQALPEGETFSFPVAVDPQTGSVRILRPPKRLGSATNVTATATANQAEELTPFQKALNEANAGEVQRIVNSGGRARTLEPTIARLQDVATDPNVKSGTAQPYITGIQGLAESVGIDISGIANSLGIDMGDLSTKEELSSLGSRFTVDLADKIAGNLNTTEINLLRDSGAQLGKSPEANLKVIANIKAANELAKEYANRVQSVTNQSQFRQLQQERDARGAEVFRERRDAILAEMKARRNARRQSQGQGGGQKSEGRNIPEIDINAAQSELREGEKLGRFDPTVGEGGGWPVIDKNGNNAGFIIIEPTDDQ